MLSQSDRGDVLNAWLNQQTACWCRCCFLCVKCELILVRVQAGLDVVLDMLEKDSSDFTYRDDGVCLKAVGNLLL